MDETKRRSVEPHALSASASVRSRGHGTSRPAGVEALLNDELAGWLRDRLGCASVVDLRRLSGGASRETWAFVAVSADGVRTPLVLRRDPPGAPGRGMRLEAALLRAAAAAGVRVPALVAADDASLVLEFVDGETIPRRILRDDRFARAREALAIDAGAAIAAVHRIDPASLGIPLDGNDQLDQFREILHSLSEPYPLFELAFRALEASRPVSCRTVVVHGDYRLGNLIVGEGGLRAVLDWELAHLGDPHEDLGWFCVRAWRFGSALPAGGVGSYDDLVGAYERAGGGRVDREALRWWEALGTLKWGVMCALQASFHLSGLSRSVELAAIGRRVCEVEWDLLEYLR